MKPRTLLMGLCLTGIVFSLGMELYGQGKGGTSKGGASEEAARPLYKYNPTAFQNYVVSPSSPIMLLGSDEGKDLLLHSPNAKAKDYLRLFHGEEAAAQWDTTKYFQFQRSAAALPPSPRVPTVPTAPIVTGCGTTSGTPFNLEPRANAVPQNTVSLDFLLDRVSTGGDLVVQGANDFRAYTATPDLWNFSFSGYYVHRATTGCTPDYEGGLPSLTNPLDTSDQVSGGGDPIVVADPAHDAFFYSDLRLDCKVSGIGLFRNTASRLLNTNACPNGTHSLAQAAGCWPSDGTSSGSAPGSAGMILNPQSNYCSYPTTPTVLLDRPDIGVDRRTTGTGAGDVYVTYTHFFGYYPTTQIEIIACKNNFASASDCSPPQVISGIDTKTQFSNVSVRSNGTVTVTYVDVDSTTTQSGKSLQFFNIKYVSCTPNGAPSSPTCNSPVLVTSEYQPLAVGSTLTDNSFRIATYPKHVERADGTAFVFWDRCHVFPDLPFSGGQNCANADIVMSVSTNVGATWSSPRAVNAGFGHQVMPRPVFDANTNITNIAYLNCNDSFKNRCTISAQQVPAGSTTPGSLIIVTSGGDSPAAEANLPSFLPQFGDYIGAAARGTGAAGGSRLYVGYTSNLTLGTYSQGTQTNPESNNFLIKVVYP